MESTVTRLKSVDRLSGADVLRIIEEDANDSGECSSVHSESEDDNETDEVADDTIEMSSSESEEEAVGADVEATVQSYLSRNKGETWHSVPVTAAQGRSKACNVIRQKAGPTRYSNRAYDSELSSF